MEGRKEFWPGSDDEFRVMVTLEGCRDPRRAPSVVRITEAGCTIRFEGISGPTLYEGRELEITLDLKNARAQASRFATVLGGADVDKGRAYQLRFIQVGEERLQLRRLLERHFNRRRAFRVAPEHSMPIKAELLVTDTNWRAAAKVVDVSATGIALSTEASHEKIVGDVAAFHLELLLPEQAEPVKLEANVIARDIHGGSVTYRLCYIDDDTVEFKNGIDRLVSYIMTCQRVQLQNQRDD